MRPQVWTAAEDHKLRALISLGQGQEHQIVGRVLPFWSIVHRAFNDKVRPDSQRSKVSLVKRWRRLKNGNTSSSGKGFRKSANICPQPLQIEPSGKYEGICFLLKRGIILNVILTLADYERQPFIPNFAEKSVLMCNP